MGRIKNKRKQKLLEKTQFLLSGYFLVIAICFLMPLVYIKTTLDPVLYPRFLALGITVFIVAGLLYFEVGKKRINISSIINGYSIAFLIFIFISVSSLFWATNPMEGLTDIFKWPLIFFLSILVTYLISNSAGLKDVLIKGIVINALLFSVLGIVQYFENGFMNPDPNALYEVKGLMAHKNQYSFSLFVLLPFLLIGVLALNKTWQKFSIAAILMVLAILLVLQTRSVWLALFISGIGTGFLLIIVNLKSGLLHLKNKNHKRFILGGLILILLLVILIIFYPVGPLKVISARINTVFDPQFTSNEWRKQIWNATFQLSKENPLIGVGAGNWKISVYPYYTEYLPSVYRHWRNPHNDYLLVLSEKGLPGLLAFVSIFLFLIFYGIRNMIRSSSIKQLWMNTFLVFGIVGYMVISFFSFPNERINHLIFFSVMAAYTIAEDIKYKENSQYSKIWKGWVILPILIVSYMAIHFGSIVIKSEMNIVKAQAAQEKRAISTMEKFAIKGYSVFAPIEPNHSFPVSMYIGIAKYHKKEYKEALRYFKTSYYQHPTSISVMNNIGSVYGHLGILDSTIVYNKKSLDIFPHYEYGLLNLAKAYYLNKEFENAYQTILCCDPKSSNKDVMNLRLQIEGLIEE